MVDAGSRGLGEQIYRRGLLEGPPIMRLKSLTAATLLGLTLLASGGCGMQPRALTGGGQ
jgi:hypothetical protein